MGHRLPGLPTWKLVVNNEQFFNASYEQIQMFNRVLSHLAQTQNIERWHSVERQQSLYVGDGELPSTLIALAETTTALEITSGQNNV